MQEEEFVFPKRIIKSKVAEWLDGPFGDDEIFVALKLCSRDKAPKLDDFTSIFVLENWNQA